MLHTKVRPQKTATIFRGQHICKGVIIVHRRNHLYVIQHTECGSSGDYPEILLYYTYVERGGMGDILFAIFQSLFLNKGGKFENKPYFA